MPDVINPNLTLTTVNDFVTIEVTCDVSFNRLERNLKDLGMKFHSHVEVYGSDGGANGAALVTLPRHDFDEITQGNGAQVIPLSLSTTVPRSVLQEDVPGNDEIVSRIRVHTNQAPVAWTEDVYTNEVVLLG